MMQRGIATQPTDATVITIGPKLDPTASVCETCRTGGATSRTAPWPTQAALTRISAALPWLRG